MTRLHPRAPRHALVLAAAFLGAGAGCAQDGPRCEAVAADHEAAVALCERAFRDTPNADTAKRFAHALIAHKRTGEYQQDRAPWNDQPDAAERWQLLAEAFNELIDDQAAIGPARSALARRDQTDKRGRLDALVYLTKGLGAAGADLEALDMTAQSLALAQELQHKAGTMTATLQAWALLGNHGVPRSELVAIAERTIEPSSPFYPYVLQNLAGIAAHDGRLDDARRLLARARTVTDPQWGLADALPHQLAELELDAGNIAAARAAVDAATPAPTDAKRMRCHAELLAEIALADGEPLRALRTIAPHADGAADDDARGDHWRLYALRGRAEVRIGSLHFAALSSDAAIAALGRQRAALAPGELQPWQQADRHRVFADRFALAVRQNDGKAALTVAQHVASRAHLDSIVRQTGALDTSSWTIAMARDRVAHTRAVAAVAARSPVTAVRSAADLTAALCDETVLSYQEANGSLWAVLLHEGSVTMHQLGAVAEVAALAAAFIINPDDAALASRLGRILLPAAVRRGALLYIAPTPMIAAIPWAALRVGTAAGPAGVPLVEVHAIALVPSASTLLLLRDRAELLDTETPSPAIGPCLIEPGTPADAFITGCLLTIAPAGLAEPGADPDDTPTSGPWRPGPVTTAEALRDQQRQLWRSGAPASRWARVVWVGVAS